MEGAKNFHSVGIMYSVKNLFLRLKSILIFRSCVLSPSSRSLPRQQNLQQLAYHAIRTAILSGEMESGERLIETQLAQRFQVSRTPIREAIALLEHENLAQVDENGVLRVTKISAKDVAQLYDCRLALEKLSVQGAALNATPEQLEELNSLVVKAEEVFQLNGDRPHLELLDLDYQFHRLLAQSSGNPWLVSLLEQVFDKMLLLRIQTMKRNPQVLEVRVEHRRIYDAIAKHDPNEAINAIAEHLTAAKIRVVNEVYQIDGVQLTS